MEIGKRIRKIRQDKSMKQEEFGALVGSNRSVISRLESGRQLIDQELLMKFWNKLSISPHWIITGEEFGGDKAQLIQEIASLKSQLETSNAMLAVMKSDRDSKEEIIRLMKAYYSDSDKKKLKNTAP